jgi:hypothetical protein
VSALYPLWIGASVAGGVKSGGQFPARKKSVRLSVKDWALDRGQSKDSFMPLFTMKSNLLLFTFLFLVGKLLADTPRAGMGDVKRMVERRVAMEMASQAANIDELISELNDSYELNRRTTVRLNVTFEDREFEKFLAKKDRGNADDERLATSYLLEFWRTNRKAEPAVIAWYSLRATPNASWAESMSDYRVLKEHGPNDLLPKLIVLMRAPGDAKDNREWLDTLKEAYAVSTNDQQRAIAFGISMVKGMQPETNAFAKAMLSDLSAWLKSLEPAVSSSLLLAPRLKLAQALVATGTGNIDEALHYSKGTPAYTLMPLWLMSKGKWERAREVLSEVKLLPDLSEDDRAMIRTLENLLQGMKEKPSSANAR